MKQNDIDYLANYIPNHYYINKCGETGEFHTVVTDIQVSPKVKLAIKSFVTSNGNVSKIEICKMRLNNDTWRSDNQSSISLSLDKETPFVLDFLSFLNSLELPVGDKKRFSFDKKVPLETILDEINSTENLDSVVQTLQRNPNLENDIIALEHRKRELSKFEEMLQNDTLIEADWQKYFEANKWILGYGLRYVFLEATNKKLEQYAKGFDHNNDGKRIDALMKTKADVRQTVLIEIKKPNTDLLDANQYRVGCYPPSKELSGAVIQTQASIHEFIKKSTECFYNEKDEQGNFSGEKVFFVQPKGIVIAGKFARISQNEDKIKSFEHFRRNLNNPEVITYDELYQRATTIVELTT